MSIKVLSYNAHPDPQFVTTCRCGCQFVFNQSDSYFDIEHGRIIKCPRCTLVINQINWALFDPLADMNEDDNNYCNNELYDLKSRIKLHRLVKLAEEKKDKELKQMALKILKEEYGEDEESI